MPDALPLSESRREYHRFIDGLRAIAVLGVILFHCNFSYVTGGYVGVDIFFVLSGLVLGMSLRRSGEVTPGKMRVGRTLAY